MRLTSRLFKILIVDDEAEYREALQIILDDKGYATETAVNGEDALEKLKNDDFHMILTDLIMGEMDGIELLRRIKEKYNHIEVIIITGYGTIKNAVEAMKKGAYTYFIKSHETEELLREIKKIEDKIFSNKDCKKSIIQEKNPESMLITNNSKFKKIIDIAEKSAKSDVNILILGESGVGKEVFATHIHNCSNRKNRSFIPVNCSSFSDSLFESELFGHEKGAFTGAIGKRKGRFEAADKGTLFLDEVGDIPLDTQVKLLRVLETRKIERIGSNESTPVNFRLIAATNKKLGKEIVNGKFREDFFYRMSTISIEIPPLRERKEDIQMLIDFFLEKSKKKLSKEIFNIEKGVMKFLLSYDYPGNVRELKNIIDRLVVLSENGMILEKYLPECRATDIDDKEIKIIKPHNDMKYDKKMEIIRPLKDIRKEVESEYIEKVLAMCDNNISEAARKLSISRRQLFNKICEYGLK